MKRFATVLLAVLTVLSLAACSAPSSGENPETTEAVTEAVIPDIPMEYRSVTGVGGGIIVDDKIVAGTNGGAGEVGHMTVNPEESVPCNCGKYGCLEQYASANGIVRMGKVMLFQSYKPSKLRDMEKFTAKDICDLAREGEEMAMDIVDRFGEYMGRAMSYVSCTVDPDICIIGGGMSRAGTIITDAILKYYRRYAFHVSTGTSIALAELGNDAGIYGCARMIID